MIIRGLGHVGFDTLLISCISARRAQEGGPVYSHQKGGARANPVDAERPRARRGGLPLCAAEQHCFTLQDLGVLQPGRPDGHVFLSRLTLFLLA